MSEYPHIDSVYKRDLSLKAKPLIVGQFSTPEISYLQENNWLWSEKIDGTNIRIIITQESLPDPFFSDSMDAASSNGVHIYIKGRTNKATIPLGLIDYFENEFHNNNLSEKLVYFFLKDQSNLESQTIILYGEGFGGKIQSGHRYNETEQFALFDVRINHWWLNQTSVIEIANELGLPYAPIVGEGNLSQLSSFVKEGFVSLWNGCQAEGIIARPIIPLLTRRGDRVITKLKTKDFLV